MAPPVFVLLQSDSIARPSVRRIRGQVSGDTISNLSLSVKPPCFTSWARHPAGTVHVDLTKFQLLSSSAITQCVKKHALPQYVMRRFGIITVN